MAGRDGQRLPRLAYMYKLPIVLCSDWKPASIVIRLFTLSRWSHVAIVDGDYIIETTLLTGCVRIPKFEWEKKHKTVKYCELPSNRTTGDALSYARSRVGNKYDWRGIIGLAVRRGDMQQKNKEFCSELAIESADIMHRHTYRASPQTCAFLALNLKI